MSWFAKFVYWLNKSEEDSEETAPIDEPEETIPIDESGPFDCPSCGAKGYVYCNTSDGVFKCYSCYRES